MEELPGLAGLVANTAYLQAQQVSRAELRRQRLTLTLPRPHVSSALRAAVGRQYESLCERQPIGAELFRQFLRSADPQYRTAADFLRDLRGWSDAEGDAREAAARRVRDAYCRPDAASFVSFPTGGAADKCRRVTDQNRDEMLDRIQEDTRAFLRGEPFSEYLNSPFFYRFVQWKEFEEQKISDRYFYEFRTLGRGGFGEVCAVQAKHSGQMYACKKLDKRRLKKKSGERLALLEKRLLEKVSSPFLVNLAYAYDNQTHLCLVMDLMTGGDLRFHIYELGRRGLRMARVVHYAAQMASAVLHLHALDIVYRDMKPENVLLDAHGQCRLSDLGLAVELPGGRTICQKAGTTGYMAPEVLRQESYGPPVDWWSLGCSIYEMVAACLPFRAFREKVQNEELTRRTLEDQCSFTHPGFDHATQDLLRRLLRKKPGCRLGCHHGDDPRNHFFFKSVNFRRLEAGLVAPPWAPRPDVVYADDAERLRDVSEAEGVALEPRDHEFYQQFSTGAVSPRWQQDAIDSGVFQELEQNHGPGRRRRAAWESSMCVLQ